MICSLYWLSIICWESFADVQAKVNPEPSKDIWGELIGQSIKIYQKLMD